MSQSDGRKPLAVYDKIVTMRDKEQEIIDKKIEKIIQNVLPESRLLSFINNGSKRIRSNLALNYIKTNEKEADETIYGILTVGELIHNASLLHDDVIDNSELRRGITTIGKDFSQNISILCGDYVVSEAIEILSEINNIDISNRFNSCVKNMAISEIKQYFLRNTNPSLEEYIEICRGKTAGLFSAILYSCAKHLNLDFKTSEKFGELFGIAFQIKNDFDVYSSKEDKRNKVHNSVDILGIENAHALLDNYKRELKDLLQEFPNNKNRKDLEDIVNGL